MKIVIIGAGSVATNLAYGMASNGQLSVELAARDPQKAQDTLDSLNIKVKAVSINKCDKNADLYIIAVTDKAIQSVYKELSARVSPEAPIVHTSGATSIDVFGEGARHVGVLYPLQTFSRNRLIDLQEVPFYLEAEDEHLKRTLIMLVETLGADWDWLESNNRKALHVAAVFACNFTNYMLACANEILTHEGMDITVLRPLVEETVDKALDSGNPISVQSGPARRNDTKTIFMHEQYLKSHPELKEIYTLVSEKIAKKFE